MASPVEIMAEATKLPSSSDTSESQNLKEKQQQNAEVEDKNRIFWEQWNQLDQTKMFRAILVSNMNMLCSMIADQTRAIPGLPPEFIKARLVEVAVLKKLATETMVNGNYQV